IWGLTLQSKILIANARLSSLNRQWSSLEKKYVQVVENKNKVKQAEQKLSALEQLSTNRFLWANFMNVLQKSALDEVHSMRLKADQSFSTEGKTNETKIAQSKPVTSAERITVVLDARDYSPNTAGNTAGHMKLKETLANSALFQNIAQKTNV